MNSGEEHKQLPLNFEEIQAKKKDKSLWGNPLKNFIIKPVGSVLMFPVKVVGTVASGVHTGISHVTHMVSGSPDKKEGED